MPDDEIDLDIPAADDPRPWVAPDHPEGGIDRDGHGPIPPGVTIVERTP